MDGSDDADVKEITEANFNKLSAALTKAGYKDGIADGREAVFQHGFDIGYSDGLRTALEITKWKTILDLVQKGPSEVKVADSNSILDAPERDHHKFVENQGKSVEETSRQQNEYINRITTCLDADFKEIKAFLQQ